MSVRWGESPTQFNKNKGVNDMIATTENMVKRTIVVRYYDTTGKFQEKVLDSRYKYALWRDRNVGCRVMAVVGI